MPTAGIPVVAELSQAAQHHPDTPSLSPGGTGERIGVKVQELRGCDKDS